MKCIQDLQLNYCVNTNQRFQLSNEQNEIDYIHMEHNSDCLHSYIFTELNATNVGNMVEISKDPNCIHVYSQIENAARIKEIVINDMTFILSSSHCYKFLIGRIAHTALDYMLIHKFAHFQN